MVSPRKKNTAASFETHYSEGGKESSHLKSIYCRCPTLVMMISSNADLN